MNWIGNKTHELKKFIKVSFLIVAYIYFSIKFHWNKASHCVCITTICCTYFNNQPVVNYSLNIFLYKFLNLHSHLGGVEHKVGLKNKTHNPLRFDLYFSEFLPFQFSILWDTRPIQFKFQLMNENRANS